jgi:putative intracellular protease/amidase
MKPWKAVSLILIALAVAAAGYGSILVRRGFSALATPSAIEQFAATTARKMAVPSAYRQLRNAIALIESLYNSGKPVAAVCHSPGVFHRIMYQGGPLVKGKRVTRFTNGEEAAMNLTHFVPFLVEGELKRIGASMRRQPTGRPSC